MVLALRPRLLQLNLSRAFALSFRRHASVSARISQFKQVVVHSNVPVRIDGLHPHELPEPGLHETTDILARVTRSTDEEQDAFPSVQPSIEQSEDGLVNVKLAADGCAGALRIWLPFTCDVNVSTEDQGAQASSVKLRQLEGGAFDVATAVGSVSMEAVKPSMLKVATASGAIKASSLQGALTLTTEAGAVDIRRIQAITASIHSGQGPMTIGALYGNDCALGADSGNVFVSDAHGKLTVNTTSGHVRLGTADGLINVTSQSGAIQAHLIRLDGGVFETETGRVDITVDRQLDAQLQVSSGVVVEDGLVTGQSDAGQLVNLGSGSAMINVKAPSGSLQAQSYLEAMMAKAR